MNEDSIRDPFWCDNNDHKKAESRIVLLVCICRRSSVVSSLSKGSSHETNLIPPTGSVFHYHNADRIIHPSTETFVQITLCLYGFLNHPFSSSLPHNHYCLLVVLAETCAIITLNMSDFAKHKKIHQIFFVRTCSPREAFIQDLGAFIQERTACNSGILLIGDFNEALTDSYSGMSKLCSDNNLQDIMWKVLGTTDFGTHAKGRDRIDYALCSDWVATSVTNAYYEAFGYRPKGDHRNIMIDFDIEKLFGNRTQPLGPISSRNFTSQDKSSNRKYIEAKHRYCTNHNFGQRLAALQQQWDQDEAEKLDKDWQRAGEFAAKQCSKKPRGVPYVAELAKLRKRKNLLLKLISAAKLNKSFDAGIAYLTKNGHQGGLPSTLADCQTECRVTQQKIKALTKTAIHRRQNELKIALQEAIDSGDKQKSKALKHRISAERTKAMYAKLRQCGENPKAGITRLDVPSDQANTDYNSCTSWITIDAPAEIEERLLQRNRNHFGQAKDTFPTKPPFSEWCDWGASSHVAELILEGDWQSDELTDMQQCLINHMKARVTLDAIPNTISTEEWVGKIRS